MKLLKNTILETPRLIIRAPQLGDENPLIDAINRSLAELQRWMPWASDPSMTPTARLSNLLRQRHGIETDLPF